MASHRLRPIISACLVCGELVGMRDLAQMRRRFMMQRLRSPNSHSYRYSHAGTVVGT
jgi:hypothetical protein